MRDLFAVEGKTALVTGGSRGIGEMITRGFVANGVRTYISSRKADACEALASELSTQGTCIPVPADLSTIAGVESLVETLAAREERLDILVNNAGATWGASIDEFPEKGWDKVMDLNVKAVFFLTQKVLPLLRRAGTREDPARVINIGSIDALRLNPLETYSYAASKAAVHHLTRMMARRLASECINVNVVAPGPFESEMTAHTLERMRDEIVAATPRGRIGQPADMAGVARYLAAPASSYVTGAVIPVDGGLTTCR